MTADGTPRVLATLGGVIVLGVLDNGLTQLRVDSYVREVLVGIDHHRRGRNQPASPAAETRGPIERLLQASTSVKLLKAKSGVQRVNDPRPPSFTAGMSQSLGFAAADVGKTG